MEYLVCGGPTRPFRATRAHTHSDEGRYGFTVSRGLVVEMKRNQADFCGNFETAMRTAYEKATAVKTDDDLSPGNVRRPRSPDQWDF